MFDPEVEREGRLAIAMNWMDKLHNLNKRKGEVMKTAEIHGDIIRGRGVTVQCHVKDNGDETLIIVQDSPKIQIEVPANAIQKGMEDLWLRTSGYTQKRFKSVG